MNQGLLPLFPEQLAKHLPVVLEAYDPAWEDAYEQEAEVIRNLIGAPLIMRIEHIGSTAVEGLLAKSTIDVLVEVSPQVDIPVLAETMQDAGYAITTPDEDLVMFLKGYVSPCFVGQTYNIHVRRSGDWNELYFRDYLRDNAEEKRAYGALKLSLRAEHPYDTEAYTEAKSAFILRCTSLARQDYGDRHLPPQLKSVLTSA